MIGHFDRGHRLFKVLAHLDMLLEDMIPRHVVYLDEMASGLRISAMTLCSAIDQG